MLCLAAPPDLQADNSEPGCLKPAVMLEFFGRAGEAKALSLARCDGSPNLAVLDEFSVHVRPRGAVIPEEGATLRRDEQEGFVGRDIRRFDARVLSRLQDVAERWPAHRIVVVSAYRPGARVGSRHHHAQAIDIRVEGVHRAEVAEFARALPETGVGFYSASTFTHIDVRIRPSFWVDQSEPGQPSRYVPGDEEDAFFAAALAALPSRIAVAAATTLPPVGGTVATGASASRSEPVEAASSPIVARSPTSPGSTLRGSALRSDVQRTLREGLSGAFDVTPDEPSAEPTAMQGAPSPGTSMQTTSMQATVTYERVRIAAPTSPSGESEPIDWNAPW